MIGQSVGMNRDEQVGTVRLRKPDPVIEGDEVIGLPGHADPVALAGQEAFPKRLRHSQRHVLFVCARDADCSRVLAAMAGVEHHQGRRAGAPGPEGGSRCSCGREHQRRAKTAAKQ